MLAITELVTDDGLASGIPELGGLSLTTGIFLLDYPTQFLPARFLSTDGGDPSGWPWARWGAEFVLVSIGLFWAVGSYASGVGASRAQEMQADLPAWPDTVVYGSVNLDLTGPGVIQTTCLKSASGYHFRVDGLKMVRESGDEYFFLPAGWTPSSGTAILLSRSDTVRLEFTRAQVARQTRC